MILFNKQCTVGKRLSLAFFPVLYMYMYFSHPPLTTALSSHVVVVATHGGTNHHTTQ